MEHELRGPGGVYQQHDTFGDDETYSRSFGHSHSYKNSVSHAHSRSLSQSRPPTHARQSSSVSHGLQRTNSRRPPRQRGHWPFQSVTTTHSVMSVWSSADGTEPLTRPAAGQPIDVRIPAPAVTRVRPHRAIRSLLSIGSSTATGDDDTVVLDDGTGSTFRSLIPDYIINYLRGDTPETIARRKVDSLRGPRDTYLPSLAPMPASGWQEENDAEDAAQDAEKERARQQMLERRRRWWQFWRPPLQQLQHPALAYEHDVSDTCGWRAGVALWALLAMVFALAGVVLFVLVDRTSGHVTTSDAETLALGLRAVLAVVATAALATAQYVWQAVGSSPTRADVDTAHACRQWLDMGLPSVGNAVHFLRRGDAAARARVLVALAVLVAAALIVVLCGSMVLVTETVGEGASTSSSLSVHVYFLLTVVALEAATAVMLGLLLLATRTRHRNARLVPLVTLGDALASFLSDSDPTTRGACLLSKKGIAHWQRHQSLTELSQGPPLFLPAAFRVDAPLARWSRAASRRRWILSGLVWLVLFGLGLAALVLDISAAPAAVLRTGLGRFVLEQAVSVQQSTATAWTSVFSGLPQLGPVALFLVAHAHLCAYFLSHESALFAVKDTRWPLRVSVRPHGLQTTSLHQTLPPAWAALLWLLYAGEHFALSNGFLAVGVEEDGSAQTRLGFCGIGLVVFLGVAGALALLVLGLACRCSPSADPSVLRGNPLALPGGSCSAVLSARCHPLSDETLVDEAPFEMTRAATGFTTTITVPATASSHGGPLPLWLRPLAWGSVPSIAPSQDAGDAADDVGHCTYSSRPLLPLDPSRSYA